MLNIFNVRSTDGANRSFVRSCDLPERLISMLCSIMTTQVERLRFHLDGLVDGFPEFMVWNLTMDSSDDVTLLKQKILVSWTDRQKKLVVGERYLSNVYGILLTWRNQGFLPKDDYRVLDWWTWYSKGSAKNRRSSN